MEDYYEYHESKEALAEGQLPDDCEPFKCPLSNAVFPKGFCIYYRETTEKYAIGYSITMDCTYPKGEAKCPFPKEEDDGQADED